MRKNWKSLFLSALIAVVMVTSMSIPVYAQTTTSVQDLIATLQKQIETLKAQIAALQIAQSAVVGTLKVISQLREGMTGEDVKLLQEALAADQNIYPEGIISGYYGKLTALAVKRFQAKHGLEQAGSVGPKTLKKLNEALDDHPITKENNTEKHCAIVPPGHLMAPGWLRKKNGVVPVIPACQVLPPGIAAKLGLGTTTPPKGDDKDRMAPFISQISAVNLTSNSAHVAWTTNESATSKVWYATSSPVNFASATLASSNTLVINHDLAVSGLVANTLYYYVVVSADASSNTATSSQLAFTTLPSPDTTPPVLSNVSATNIASTSAHIVWSTNESATSKVWYSTSTPVVAGTAWLISDGALVNSHDVTIPSLATSTTYYYMAGSSDAAGNSATSSGAQFQTLSQ